MREYKEATNRLPLMTTLFTGDQLLKMNIQIKKGQDCILPLFYQQIEYVCYCNRSVICVTPK